MTHKFIGALAAGVFSVVGIHAAFRSGLFGKRIIQVSTPGNTFIPARYQYFAWRQIHDLQGTPLSIVISNYRFYSRYEIQYRDANYIRNIYINSVRPIDFYLNDQPIVFTNNIWLNLNAYRDMSKR